jgi:hypothetical protein
MLAWLRTRKKTERVPYSYVMETAQISKAECIAKYGLPADFFEPNSQLGEAIKAAEDELRTVESRGLLDT